MTDTSRSEDSFQDLESAAREFGLTRKYIAQLCREGKVLGTRTDEGWKVDVSSLAAFARAQEEARRERYRRTAAARAEEYHLYQFARAPGEEKSVDGVRQLSLAEAADISGLTPKYIVELCRKGQLGARRIESEWYLDAASLHSYILEQHFRRALRREELSQRRITERSTEKKGDAGAARFSSARPILHAAASLALAFFFVFGAYALVDPVGSERFAAKVGTATHIMLEGGATSFTESLSPQRTLAAAGAGEISWLDSLALSTYRFFNFFAEPFASRRSSVRVSVTPAEDPIVDAERARAAKGVSQIGGTIINNGVVNHYTTNNNTYYTTNENTITGISENFLLEKLSALDTTLRSDIARITQIGGGPPATGGLGNAVALTQRIDNLASATISDSDWSGGTIADATVSATSLNVSGTTDLGALSAGATTLTSLTSYSGIESAFFNATSTSATSTFAGPLLTTRAPTLPHTFASWIIGASDASQFDASLVINPASAVADSNLISASVNGAVRFLVDAEGDLFANNLTSVGAVTLSTTTASTFAVEGNTTLGDAITDSTTINGTLIVTGTTTASTIAGNFGVGTTTPWGKLAVSLNSGDTNTNALLIASSTSNSTTTLLSLDNTGLLTFLNATGANATTTNFAATSANITSATTTNLFATTASSTNLFSALLETGSATSTSFAVTGVTNTLLWANSLGQLAATTTPTASYFISTGSTASRLPYASSTAITSTLLYGTNADLTYASSTALTVSGTGYFGAASTSALTLSGFVANRVPYITTAGAVTSDADLTFNGTTLTATYASTTALTATTFYTTNSILTNASTTLLTVSGQSWFGGNLNLTGSTANIALGSNYLSGDGGDEGVFVDSSGNVGIGTTTPLSTLEVHGSVTDTVGGTGLLTLARAGTPTQAFIFRMDSTNADLHLDRNFSGWSNMMTFDRSSGNVGIGTTTPYAMLSVLNSGSGYSFVVEDATDDITPFVVDSAGKVGIGTTTPFSMLTVGRNEVAAVWTDTTNPQVLISGVDNEAEVVALKIQDENLQEYFRVSSTGVGSSDNGKVYVAGSLGIGTTSPQDLLSVGDSANSAIRLNVTNSNSGTAAFSEVAARNGYLATDALRILALGTGWTTSSIYVQDAGVIEAGSTLSGGLGIVARSGGMRLYTGTTERLTINTSGSVGIGTTTPSTALHVYGGASDSTITLTRANVLGSTGVWRYNDGTMDFGTVGTDALALITSNTDRLTIGTSGGVTIHGTGETLTFEDNTDTETSISFNTTGVSSPTGSSGEGWKIKAWDSGALASTYGMGIDSATLWFQTGSTDIDFYGAGTQWATIQNGELGVGTVSPAARIESLATTEQLRLSYDGSNYQTFTVDSGGVLTVGYAANSGCAGGTTLSGCPNVNFSADTGISAEMYAIYGDVDTGMYSSAADTLNFATQDTNRLSISSNGGVTVVSGLTTLNRSSAAEALLVDNADAAADGIEIRLGDNVTALGATNIWIIMADGDGTIVGDFESTAASDLALDLAAGKTFYVLDPMETSSTLTPTGGITNLAATAITSARFVCVDSAGVSSLDFEATDCVSASDARLKTNVQTLDSALEKTMLMRGITFEWIDKAARGEGTHIGFIAQEMEQVFPELVATDDEGIKSIHYDKITAILANAIQELNTKVESIVTTDAPADSFASRFLDSLFERMRAWFASATNGIGDFFANRIRTKELCVSDGNGETCVTKAQLDALIASAGSSGPQQSGETGTGGADDDAPDTDAPVISVMGNNPATIEVGGTYSDLGATVFDAGSPNIGIHTFVDGVEVQSVQIDTSTVGTHTIEYRAADAAGNTGSASRTVIVADAEPANEPASESPATGEGEEQEALIVEAPEEAPVAASVASEEPSEDTNTEGAAHVEQSASTTQEQ